MKKSIVPILALSGLIVIGGTCAVADHQDALGEVTNPSITFVEKVVLPDIGVSPNRAYEWQERGYSDIYSYYNDLCSMNIEAQGLTDEAIKVYSSVITDEEKENLALYEKKMVNASCMVTFDKYNELAGEILTACEDRMPKYVAPSYSGGGSSYSGGGSGVLTRSGGVNWFNGRKETWYSQRVLPGGGLKIPGRHVASDGTIRDADGYIVVAASDLAYGSIVETSLGTGKVYDTGCANGVTDIYVDW